MSSLERESPPARVGNFMLQRAPKNRSGAISISKQGQCYRALERDFRRGQFNYHLFVRHQNVAIYSQAWQGSSEPSIAFEVICVRRHNGKEIKGQRVEASEFYPSGSEWGKYGFTFNNRNTALRKFRELSRQATGTRKE
jgi:hypothetical protein